MNPKRHGAPYYGSGDHSDVRAAREAVKECVRRCAVEETLRWLNSTMRAARWSTQWPFKCGSQADAEEVTLDTYAQDVGAPLPATIRSVGSVSASAGDHSRSRAIDELRARTAHGKPAGQWGGTAARQRGPGRESILSQQRGAGGVGTTAAEQRRALELAYFWRVAAARRVGRAPGAAADRWRTRIR